MIRRLDFLDHIRNSRRYGKKIPEEEVIPKEYRDLLKWYENEYCTQKSTERQEIKPNLDIPPHVRIENGRIVIPSTIKEWLDLTNGD